ncbi:MAG: ABC transporter ATP-binding protein [Ilumatobacteraceae bacterium]
MSAVTDSILRVSDLNVTFATARGPLHAVRDVSIDIPNGSAVGIVGESGSGKTVLSRAVMGLLPAGTTHRTGSIEFDGSDLSTASPAQVRDHLGTGMAMIFQDPMTALNPVRRVGVQVAEGLRLRLGMDKEAARLRAADLLRLVRIPDPIETLRKFPYQLSGGMRQRVMIAMAIACSPKLLFADEPTTALDVTVQAQILQLLGELRRDLGMSMVLITHDLGVVAGHTDEVVVMYAGEIVERARTSVLFANMKMPYTKALLTSIPTVDMPSGRRLPVIEGRLPDPVNRPAGCAFAERCSFATDKCRTEHPPLVTQGDHSWRCWYPLGGQ